MTDQGFRPKFAITGAIADGLTPIERARGFLEAATLSEDWVKAMGARALVLEAHHTTHIEGTRLTLEQAELLMAGGAAPEANPDDVRELLNYRSAFDFVSEYLASKSSVTETLVREIHRRLVDGVRGGSAAPGEYRTVQNYVVNSRTGAVIHTPPARQEVPVLMGELVSWLNSVGGVHAILVSGIAQFQLVYIHPFLDGNGRTSRLLSTLCLYRAGYDFKRLFTISEYYDRDRAAFYGALRSVAEHGMDLTGWLEYYVEGLAAQMREVTEKGRQAIQRDLIVSKYGLSNRQSKALLMFLERGDLRLDDLVGAFPDVNKRTLQRDLKALVDKGIMRQSGTARAAHYLLNIKKLR